MRAGEMLGDRIAILGTAIGLQLSHNAGIAFGIAIPDPWETILIGSALLLLALAAWYERRSHFRACAFGLILGGALGNIVDRILDGRVTDYFQVYSFPIFNVADSAITIGAAILIIGSFFDA